MNQFYCLIRQTICKISDLNLGLARMDNGHYKCLICTKTFMHKSTARRHYNEVHIQSVRQGGIPNECLYCGKKYSTPRYLKEHMSNVHQVTSKMLSSSFI